MPTASSRTAARRSSSWASDRRTGASRCRYRHLAQHRPAPAGRARARQGRGDVPRQLQRRADRRAAADEMIEPFKKSGKVGCFLAVRPPLTFHLVRVRRGRRRAAHSRQRRLRHLDQRRLLRLPQRDLRLHQAKARSWCVEPFQRLIEDGQLMAYQARGLLARDGYAPATSSARGYGRARRDALAAEARRARGSRWRRRDEGLAAGRAGRAPVASCAWARIPTTSRSAPAARCCSRHGRGRRGSMCIWCVLSAAGAARERGARLRGRFPAGRRARARRGRTTSATASFPTQGAEIKAWFEKLKRRVAARCDLDPPRRRCAPGPSRDQPADLEHVPRSPDPGIRDPQMGRRSGPARTSTCRSTRRRMARKVELLMRHFGSQRSKHWFDEETFRGLAAAARHGMPGAGSVRRSLPRPQAHDLLTLYWPTFR